MSDLSLTVAVVGIALWAALGILEKVWVGLKLKGYRVQGQPWCWYPRRITLPDYHPMYRWGDCNFWRQVPTP